MAGETQKTPQQLEAEKAKALADQKKQQGQQKPDATEGAEGEAKKVEPAEDEFEEVQVTVRRAKPKDYGARQMPGQVPYLVVSGKHSTRNKEGEKILVPVGGVIYKDPTSVNAMDDCLERLEVSK